MVGAIVAIGVGLFFVPIWIITGPTLHLCLRFKKFIISQKINKGKIEDLISTKVKKNERLVSSNSQKDYLKKKGAMVIFFAKIRIT